ncbi:MAG: adenylate/guanylate cyclase domain-containing protein [Alphaproteobacteria bacterium]|nr:adenylate/guanylate cyclase domain-containing protein [Alphaproteobacteria bacterium]
MTNNATARTIDEITHWLMTEVRLSIGSRDVDQDIVDRLIEAGLPLSRYTTGVPSLHPQVDSFSVLWERGKGTTLRQFRESTETATQLQRSPIIIAYQEGKSRRYRLEAPATEDEYELLGQFRKAGMTDYFVLALPMSDGSSKVMSFSTDRPGGFLDSHLEILNGLQHPLSVIVELGYFRHLTTTLMETYVGPVAGRRVLSGEIRRGVGETFRAVIWFCDLKGFTALSEDLPGQVLIDTLNAYFDATTTAIEDHGGEILKFIGDAVLAIFQPDKGDEEAAALSALAAAAQAVQRIETENSRRAATDEPRIECGIALHIGDVIYGNVGGRNRLDFTVIGPAVNLASRIEALTRELDRPVLVSAEIAALVEQEFENLGTFSLKGVSEEKSVHAPMIPKP